MSQRTLKPVATSADDPETWKRLLNILFLHEEDRLFEWAKSVQAAVCGEGKGGVNTRCSETYGKAEKGDKRMAKLTTEGRQLLPPGRYVLEVVAAEPINRYGSQLKFRLRVVEGEHESYTFFDYSKLAEEGSLKVGSKAAEIFAACLDRHLAADEELDTDDLIGKKFEAMVSMKKSGKGNRVEHGAIELYCPKKAEPK